MKIRPDFRMTVLAAALAASASAWAAYSSSLVPALTADTPAPSTQAESTARPAPSTEKEMALEANESVVVIEDVEKPAAPAPVVERSRPAPTPVAETAHAEDPITVTKPRLTEDQRIHAEVMERLAANPRLTGRIGVESHDSVVHLSGLLATPGQVDLAERDARSIRGVRAVQNEIQSRIGIRRS
jgi:hypothetical protein